VQAAWANAGIAIASGTTNQVHNGTPVASLTDVQPGDLLFIPGSFGTPANPRHVGMYVGDGLVEDAYDEQRGVILEQLSTWAPQIVDIRQIAGASPPPAGAAAGSLS
jgi:cell wall-associated NlpC family hydrolase